MARASYLYLDEGAAWSISPRPEESEETSAGAVTAGVRADDRTSVSYPTSVGRHCTFCDYQSICPSREEIVGRRLHSGW